MSKAKKQFRAGVNNAIFKRDEYKCRVCGAEKVELDAHHIMPRKDMPFGGYVKGNLISLCDGCHRMAEAVLQGECTNAPHFGPEKLYEKLGTDFDTVYAECEKLAEEVENFFDGLGK